MPFDALGALPLSTIDDAELAAIKPRWQRLVEDPRAMRVYAVEIHAYQPGLTSAPTGHDAVAENPLSSDPAENPLPGETVIYLSDFGFRSKATDTPASTFFAPRLLAPFEYERTLLGGSDLTGRAAVGWGEIRIAIGDGGFDRILTDYAVDGREVTVKVGGADLIDGGPRVAVWDYAEFGTIARVTAIDWGGWDEAEARLRVRDKGYKLDIPLQQNVFAGTGGDEGGADLKDKPRPLAEGAELLNVPAVLVNPALLDYRAGDAGSGVVIDAVYDRGDPLTPAVDWTDRGDGRFRLTSVPAGLITCDLHSSVSSTQQIIARLLVSRGALTLSEIDWGTLATLQALQPAPVGIAALSDERPFVSAALNALMAGIGGWWGFARDGRFQAGRLDLPSGNPEFRFSDREIIAMARLPLPWEQPWYRCSVGYQRIYTTQTTDLAGAVIGTDRQAFLQNVYRVAADGDAALQLRHALAIDSPLIEGLFQLEADAAAEALRRRLLYGIDPDSGIDRAVYMAQLKTQPFTLDIGRTVLVTYPRFLMSNGKLLRVVGIRESASDDAITVWLFG